MTTIHHSLLFLTLYLFTLSQGAITDVLDRCCNVGRQWYISQAERCTPYTASVAGVEPSDQSACTAVVQLCCLQYRQEQQCMLGKQAALSGVGCSALHSREASQDARECCNCCQLGRTAREQGISCSLFSRYSNQCGSSFTDCCHSGSVQRPYPERPQPTTASFLPPPERSQGSGLCSLFPGQLCEQICFDVPGSYECSCRKGYNLQSDRRTCRSTEVNECSLGTHTCSYDQNCVDTPEGFRCENIETTSCQHGFIWNRNTRQCEDIDECSGSNGFSLCPGAQFCINTAGSFRCLSLDGTEISDAEPYDGLLLETTLPSTITSTATTTVSPIPVDSQCDLGMAFNVEADRCEDIDECKLIQCPELNEMCRNTIGSYTCVRMCGKGFKYELRHSCEDINECAMNKDTCSEGQTCENSIGSYHCRRSLSCGTGYTLEQYSQECIDDDECRMGTHNCGPSRECKNIPGSFRCVTKICPHGYRLDYDNGECNPVVCGRGMKPDSAGNCIDIDECVERPEVCRADQECRNQVGSYTCINRLTCSPGYKPNEAATRCDDIDECRAGTHDCTGPLMECINRPGSFLCQCPTGYQINRITKSCEDVDECVYDPHICDRNSKCENTLGSYRCVCGEGFIEDRISGNVLCKDIDECSRPGMCQHKCTNSWGSFECSCNEGYQISADKRTCDDADECQMAAEKGLQLCLGRCENTHGSFVCTCPPGYLLNEDGVTCQDINECAMRLASCRGASDICINTRGGYKCQEVECPKGFVRAPVLSSRNSKIRIPADLFTMRGPQSPFRRLVFDLKVVKAEDPITGQTRVDRSFFNVHQVLQKACVSLTENIAVKPATFPCGNIRIKVRENEAVVQLLREVEGPQDVELQLDMNIYSKEIRSSGEEVFFGTAIAKIFIYVTRDDW